MKREPIDDRDRRIQDDWNWRDRQIDRDYAHTQSERQEELDRGRSGEALAARYGLDSSPSPPGRIAEAAKDYKRRPFEQANPERVALNLRSFASMIVAKCFSPHDFELNKEYALNLIDRHLPPSDAKEAIFAAVRNMEFGFPITTEDKLVALARQVRSLGG